MDRGNQRGERIRNSYDKDPNYNPYPRAIYVHNNSLSNTHWIPDLGNDFGKLFMLKFGLSRPLVVWDGIKGPEYLLDNGEVNPDYRICVQEKDIKTAILDAANDFERLEVNPTSLDCSL